MNLLLSTDLVICFALQMEECDLFHDSDSFAEDACDNALELLDIHGDTLPVTIVKLTSTDSSSKINLFNFIAGGLTESMDHTHDSWTVSTTMLKNDILHERIRDTCREHLRNDLSFTQTKLEYFEKNAPSFVVAEKLPCSGDDELVNAQWYRDRESEIDNRKAYKYSHSNNRGLFVRIFEPASPSVMQVGLPDGKIHTTKLVGT